ncbi:Uncharacterised protein [Segatella copri]|nr:Uncharacterised protein [Segatella copri]
MMYLNPLEFSMRWIKLSIDDSLFVRSTCRYLFQ